MKLEWNVTLLCFGPKDEMQQLETYFKESLVKAENGEEEPFLCEEEDLFVINPIEHGKTLDVLTVDFPLLYAGRHPSEAFSEVAGRFKNITFIAGGIAEAPENNMDVYDLYYAATDGNTIDTATYTWEGSDMDEMDDAREEAAEFFGEGMGDFLNDSVVDEVAVFEDAAVCKALLKLCYKYNEVYSYLFMLWTELPHDFWLDKECLALVPADFWEDTEICEELLKKWDDILPLLPKEVQESVKGSAEGGTARENAATSSSAEAKKAKKPSATAIKITGKKVLRTIRREFQARFPYLGLSFQNPDQWEIAQEKGGTISLLDDGKKLAEVRTVPPPKGEKEISVHGSVLAKNLKSTFLKTYGLYVQVTFQKGDTVYYTNAAMDAMNLTQLNKKMEEDGCVKKPGNASKA